MNKQEIFSQINKKKTYLCIGLDPDLNKIPKQFNTNLDGLLDFHKQIIDSTQDLCIAYKPNLAFYETFGKEGWQLLEETLKYIPKEHFIIADAKRGDIGNTSKMYANSFFSPELPFRVDAITVNPYMGSDSVSPFLCFPDKWAIILALTSNLGSNNFQKLRVDSGRFLYEEVIIQSQNWGTSEQIMYVVGATEPEALASIRKLIPNHFLLIPGVGEQGGDLKKISLAGLNSFGGILVNVSRSILYAPDPRKTSLLIQQEMKTYL